MMDKMKEEDAASEDFVSDTQTPNGGNFFQKKKKSSMHSDYHQFVICIVGEPSELKKYDASCSCILSRFWFHCDIRKVLVK